MVGALAVFFGALGSAGVGNVPNASAVDGDICLVQAGASGSGTAADPYVLDYGVDNLTGVVFRVEDTESAPGSIFNADVWVDGAGAGTSLIYATSIITNFEGGDANVGYEVIRTSGIGVGQAIVNIVDPLDFNSAEGVGLNNINSWLNLVGAYQGYFPQFATTTGNICGGGANDGWGFVAVACTEPGTFQLNVAPVDEASGITLVSQGNWITFYCPADDDREARTAELSIQRSVLETVPAPAPGVNFSSSLVTVSVRDQYDDRLDGVQVEFHTDNCRFEATDPVGTLHYPLGGTAVSSINPASGAATVRTITDTDTTADTNFLVNNPWETEAGTAEVVLNCALPHGTPGVANITATVSTAGAPIVLTGQVTVIGQTAGLELTLTPDKDFVCGAPVLATASAVDANGAPVSNGTVINFTTISASGVVGGYEGAQGAAPTVDGVASVNIATNPAAGDPGSKATHTVIASVYNAAGGVTQQAVKTYECTVPAAPAPTQGHTSPGTGTGTGSITPPNTGNAGLASASSSASLLVIAGAAAFVLAGLASVRFARN